MAHEWSWWVCVVIAGCSSKTVVAPAPSTSPAEPDPGTAVSCVETTGFTAGSGLNVLVAAPSGVLLSKWSQPANALAPMALTLRGVDGSIMRETTLPEAWPMAAVRDGTYVLARAHEFALASGGSPITYIEAQILSADLEPLGDPIQLSDDHETVGSGSIGRSSSLLRVVPTSDGILVVWRDEGVTQRGTAFAKLVDASGHASSSAIKLAVDSNFLGIVTANDTGLWTVSTPITNKSTPRRIDFFGAGARTATWESELTMVGTSEPETYLAVNAAGALVATSSLPSVGTSHASAVSPAGTIGAAASFSSSLHALAPLDAARFIGLFGTDLVVLDGAGRAGSRHPTGVVEADYGSITAGEGGRVVVTFSDGLGNSTVRAFCVP